MEEELSNFMENTIIITSNETITFEEENEIIDLAKQVLKRNSEIRQVFRVTHINTMEE